MGHIMSIGRIERTPLGAVRRSALGAVAYGCGSGVCPYDPHCTGEIPILFKVEVQGFARDPGGGCTGFDWQRLNGDYYFAADLVERHSNTLGQFPWVDNYVSPNAYTDYFRAPDQMRSYKEVDDQYQRGAILRRKGENAAPWQRSEVTQVIIQFAGPGGPGSYNAYLNYTTTQPLCCLQEPLVLPLDPIDTFEVGTGGFSNLDLPFVCMTSWPTEVTLSVLKCAPCPGTLCVPAACGNRKVFFAPYSGYGFGSSGLFTLACPPYLFYPAYIHWVLYPVSDCVWEGYFSDVPNAGGAIFSARTVQLSCRLEYLGDTVWRASIYYGLDMDLPGAFMVNYMGSVTNCENPNVQKSIPRLSTTGLCATSEFFGWY